MKRAWLGVVCVVVVGCSSSSGGGAGVVDAGADTSRADVGNDVQLDGDHDTGAVDSADASATDSGSSSDSGSIDAPSDTTTSDTASSDTSSASDTSVTPIDSGRADSAVTEVAVDTGTTGEGTVGNTCTSSTECDPLGTGDNVCSMTGYPTPVCIGVSCDPGSGTTIVACDNADGVERGVCLMTAPGSGVCLPTCSFDDTGAAPTGCKGKDACNVYGWSAAAPISGIGFCYAGCFADADCPTGQKCQTETGACAATLTAYAKKPGDPCTYKTTAGAVQDCNCYASNATDLGYCTTFCEIGDTAHACPTGMKCSAVLPTKDSTGAPLFTTSPSGMAGSCLVPCTTDADCKDGMGASLSSTCQDTTDGKVCLPFTL